ncbi:anhydro-N-acetylmuramic acid kinase, partial [Micromonospora sp. 4G55]|uniref:anhydro-N-acetylmuramic acid kinase n=1 Tax=Micromonospora sp. 4G55 TaxID=2806102 RepID=UPI001EE439CF
MKIVGLMSGTSYDGVDVVAAEFTADGDTLRMRPLGHRGLDYDDALREAIGALLPPAATTIEAVCRLDNALGEVFAAAAALGVELAGGRRHPADASARAPRAGLRRRPARGDRARCCPRRPPRSRRSAGWTTPSARSSPPPPRSAS